MSIDEESTVPEQNAELRSRGGIPALLIAGCTDPISVEHRALLRLPQEFRVVRGQPVDEPASGVLALRDPLLSRRHVRISRQGERAFIEDEGSLNGTFVDGRRIVGPVELAEGCVISFGAHAAVFRTISEDHIDAIEEDRASPLGPIATLSPSLAMTSYTLRRLAGSNVEILLTGETGVGKEVYARAIHRVSGREGRFVAINCAAIPTELAESELFGYARGAHSTASQAKQGLISAAHGGTLFLDEVGDLQPRLQAKLLRFLQEREVTPLGSTTSRRVDVRIIAATSGPITGTDGSFRDDFLARLGAEPVQIPPLRCRVEDLGALLAHFTADAGAGAAIDPAAFRGLYSYAWPRNVRELEKVVRRALALATDRRIGMDRLPVAINEAAKRGTVIEMRRRPRPAPSRGELEALLGKHNGNVMAVARELDRQWNVVWRWLVKLQIRPEHFRSTSDQG